MPKSAKKPFVIDYLSEQDCELPKFATVPATTTELPPAESSSDNALKIPDFDARLKAATASLDAAVTEAEIYYAEAQVRAAIVGTCTEFFVDFTKLRRLAYGPRRKK